MTLVIDTSVIIKWFVNEDGHKEAIKLLDTSEQLICPDFALAETTNVLWRKTRINEIKLEQAKLAVEKMIGFFDEIIPCSSHITEAFSLAEQLDHSIYDCLFLALANQNSKTVLVTDDVKFSTKCANAGFADKVRALKDSNT